MILQKFSEIIFAISKTSDGNMSFMQGNPIEVLKNRQNFLSKLGINLNSVVEVKQVHHGNKVIYFDKAKKDIPKADGLITNKSDLFLLIKVADCLPVGIFDPINKALGLIHAGRKGLKKGIIKNAIKTMSGKFKSHPKDLIIQIGPSIGPCCYRMDLWKEAENQLTNCGVLKKNINNPRICTYESKEYYSHRRSEDKNQRDFRFATILGLKNAS